VIQGDQPDPKHGVWALPAFVVPVGNRVVAFFESPETQRTYRIAGGETDRVLASFKHGDTSC